MRLADLGEFGFIERIRHSARSGPGTVQGIGDDCAALELPPGQLLLTTTDMLLEGVHFRREWTDLKTLGRKSVAVNVSDIAAMGGTPRHLFLGLGVPADMIVEDLEAFVEGVLEGAALYGASLAGGDTCRSPGPLVVSVTAEGAVPEGEMLRRSGARPGDAIYVSGTVGDSALALRQLQAGVRPEPLPARRHHDPRARTELGRALAAAAIPTAMIDVSDGLLADLGHILSASGVGAELLREALPLSEPFRRALEGDPDLWELALNGGEDYELLFTVPQEREGDLAGLADTVGLPLSKLGRVSGPGAGLSVRDRFGRECRPGRGGYNHFGPAE